MDSNSDQAEQTRRDVALLRAQVHALRVLVLRLCAIVALALMAVGLVLPAWHDDVHDRHVTVRVLTVGFTALSEPVDQFGVAASVGFLGLLLVVALLAGLLAISVIQGTGHAEGALARTVIETLAVIGSVVAVLFSLVAYGSDQSDVRGGPGALLLLVGVVAAVAVLRYRPWQDLWIVPRRPGLRPTP
jgi:hypothetical protein